MTITLDRTAEQTRNDIRGQIGRKTPAEIRALILDREAEFVPEHLSWLAQVADRLAVSGYLTLSDVTDEEFDEIVGEYA